MQDESLYDYSHWKAFGFQPPLKHFRNADLKHDLDLVRKIMIQLRDREDLKPAPVVVDGYEPVFVARHMLRLHDAGLIDGQVHRALGLRLPWFLPLI